MGLTAFINLANGSIDIQETPQKELKKFLSCRGYAAKLLYEKVGPEVEPFSPENLLIFSVGFLTGTPWPTAARYMVTTKSPLTGAYGYANSSGFFGPELKKAGFDVLAIYGRAKNPVVLKIEGKVIEIIDGSRYWGKTTGEVERELKECFPGCRVAGIGPAGENLVRFSSVINDFGRAAGRCGVGAVMGSKNLKAIAVKSSQIQEVPKQFKEVAIHYSRQVRDHPGVEGLRKWGTAVLMDPKNTNGDQPTRNHQLVQFEGNTKVNAAALAKYVVKNTGCYACPIRCSRHSKVESGMFACEVEGPEYETMNAFGPMCGNDDLELIIYANLLCNELGLDTISTGVVIAFAMECHQHGLLSDPNLNLEWGDKESIAVLVRKIAYRDGIGDLLAEGVKRASEKIGPATLEFALHVKGMEIPRQDPRVCKGFGLGHAVSNRGADHLYALPTIDLAGHADVAKKIFPDIYPQIMEVNSEEYKGRMLKFTEAYCAISDALGICKFSTTETYSLYPEDLAEGLTALGIEFTGEELMRAGERIVNLERMYNVRQGFSRKDDMLPKRFLKEAVNVYHMVPSKDGGLLRGEVLKSNLLTDLNKMLDEYYQVRGWGQNGIPTSGKLKELDLEELIKDLPDLEEC